MDDIRAEYEDMVNQGLIQEEHGKCMECGHPTTYDYWTPIT
jgi:hypothetical protein